MQVAEAVRWAAEQLAVQSGTPRLDAELLLAAVLSKERAWLRAHDDGVLNEHQQDAFAALIARRVQGEPVAYLLGCQEFWSLPLKVAPHTLIPRPDTELLVEAVLRLAPSETNCVLDLGTGTGAIALALKHERPQWAMVAVDRIPEAVSLAAENARFLQLYVECMVSDWYAGLQGRRFHVIVSNPPYIDAQDAHLSGDGVRFEPLSALVAARQGLQDLERIIQEGPAHLEPGGLLAVEHGYTQGPQVVALFNDAGFDSVQTLADLAGMPRVTFGFWNSQRQYA